MSFQTESGPVIQTIWAQASDKLHKMYIYGKIMTPKWVLATIIYIHEQILDFANRYDPETMIFSLGMALIILIVTLILNDKINSQVIKNKNSRIESLRQDVGDLEHHLELQNSSNLDLTRERFRLNKELKNVKSELGDLKNIQEKLELDLFEARTRRLASEEEQDSIHSQNMRALHKKYKQDRRAKKDSTIRHIIDVINYLPARTSETSNKIKRMYACIAKLATDFEIDMGNSKEYLEKLLNFQMSSVDFTRYISDTLNQQIIGST